MGRRRVHHRQRRRAAGPDPLRQRPGHRRAQPAADVGDQHRPRLGEGELAVQPRHRRLRADLPRLPQRRRHPRLHRHGQSSLPWIRPQITYTDTDVTPGVKYTYRVSASDGTNTSAQSPGTRRPPCRPPPRRIRQQVLADGANLYWRYDAASGRTTRTFGPATTAGSASAAHPRRDAGRGARRLQGVRLQRLFAVHLQRPAARAAHLVQRRDVVQDDHDPRRHDHRLRQRPGPDQHHLRQARLHDQRRPADLRRGARQRRTDHHQHGALQRRQAWHQVVATAGQQRHQAVCRRHAARSNASCHRQRELPGLLAGRAGQPQRLADPSRRASSSAGRSTRPPSTRPSLTAAQIASTTRSGPPDEPWLRWGRSHRRRARRRRPRDGGGGAARRLGAARAAARRVAPRPPRPAAPRRGTPAPAAAPRRRLAATSRPRRPAPPPTPPRCPTPSSPRPAAAPSARRRRSTCPAGCPRAPTRSPCSKAARRCATG